MLAAFENHIHAAIGTRLAPATIHTGPYGDGDIGTGAVLMVQARRLSLRHPAPFAAQQLEREPAHAVLRLVHTAPATGDPEADPQSAFRTIPLPDDITVLEVQYPPGRILRRGTDYYREGNAVRLYRALPHGAEVHVLRRGDAARGYQQQIPAVLFGRLVAFADTMAAADGLLRAGLSWSLAACEPAPVLTGTVDERLQARLVKGRLVVLGMERGWHALDDGTHRLQAVADLRLEAMCEWQITAGSPDPEGVIVAIHHKTWPFAAGPPADWSIITDS